MAILITGVAGFIASHVAVYLVKKYPELNFIGIDKLSYCSSTKNFSELQSNLLDSLPRRDSEIHQAKNWQFYKINLLEEDRLEEIFLLHKITTVMHFAAESHVCNSFKNSLEFTKNNVVGTHLLLELAKKYNITKFIHVSTDETYGSKDSISTEDTILDPTNPYAATKAAAEHLVKSYYHSFKLPIIISRGNNVYGPKQYPEKVIPRFLTRLMQGKACVIQGSGEQKRSFLYISDVVNAFEILLFKGKIGEIYNIGSEKEYSIKEVAEKCISLFPLYNVDKGIEYTEDRPFNDHRYYISSEKIEALGWKPMVDFDTGLKLTLEWYAQINPDTYW
jgi:dTDP-glucose 4,6-dehydratase